MSDNSRDLRNQIGGFRRVRSVPPNIRKIFEKKPGDKSGSVFADTKESGYSLSAITEARDRNTLESLKKKLKESIREIEKDDLDKIGTFGVYENRFEKDKKDLLEELAIILDPEKAHELFISDLKKNHNFSESELSNPEIKEKLETGSKVLASKLIKAVRNKVKEIDVSLNEYSRQIDVDSTTPEAGDKGKIGNKTVIKQRDVLTLDETATKIPVIDKQIVEEPERNNMTNSLKIEDPEKGISMNSVVNSAKKEEKRKLELRRKSLEEYRERSKKKNKEKKSGDQTKTSHESSPEGRRASQDIHLIEDGVFVELNDEKNDDKLLSLTYSPKANKEKRRKTPDLNPGVIHLGDLSVDRDEESADDGNEIYSSEEEFWQEINERNKGRQDSYNQHPIPTLDSNRNQGEIQNLLTQIKAKEEERGKLRFFFDRRKRRELKREIAELRSRITGLEFSQKHRHVNPGKYTEVAGKSESGDKTAQTENLSREELYKREFKKIDEQIEKVKKDIASISWINSGNFWVGNEKRAQLVQLEQSKTYLQRAFDNGVSFENAKKGGYTASEFSMKNIDLKFNGKSGSEIKAMTETDLDAEIEKIRDLIDKNITKLQSNYSEKDSMSFANKFWDNKKTRELNKNEATLNAEIKKQKKYLRSLEKQKIKFLGEKINEDKSAIESMQNLADLEEYGIRQEDVTNVEKEMKKRLNELLFLAEKRRGVSKFYNKVKWSKEYRKEVTKTVATAVVLAGVGYMTAATVNPIILNNLGMLGPQAIGAPIYKIILAKTAAGIGGGLIAANASFLTNSVISRSLRELFMNDNKKWRKTLLNANFLGALFGGLGGAVAGYVNGGGESVHLVDSDNFSGVENTDAKSGSVEKAKSSEINFGEKMQDLRNAQNPSILNLGSTPDEVVEVIKETGSSDNSLQGGNPGSEKHIDTKIGSSNSGSGIEQQTATAHSGGEVGSEKADIADTSIVENVEPNLGTVTIQGNESIWRILEQRLNLDPQEIVKEITTKSDLDRLLNFLNDNIAKQIEVNGLQVSDNYFELMDDLQFKLENEKMISIEDPFWKAIPDNLKLSLGDLQKVINKE